MYDEKWSFYHGSQHKIPVLSDILALNKTQPLPVGPSTGQKGRSSVIVSQACNTPGLSRSVSDSALAFSSKFNGTKTPKVSPFFGTELTSPRLLVWSLHILKGPPSQPSHPVGFSRGLHLLQLFIARQNTRMM